MKIKLKLKNFIERALSNYDFYIWNFFLVFQIEFENLFRTQLYGYTKIYLLMFKLKTMIKMLKSLTMLIKLK